MVLIATILLVGCARREPFPHQAYIWQRAWTPAVSAALSAQAPQFSGWRVLALQVIGAQVIATTPDLAALSATALPVRAVVRIEGARSPLAVAALASELAPLLEHWRAAGVQVAGIEIDHDCASAALADYAQWLRELRAALPTRESLSITALPTWMEATGLDAVLAAVDHSVLQVHAVERPDRALFDTQRALDWTQAYVLRAPHPVWIALPAYGVRVAASDDGQTLAVDAETEVDRVGAGGHEMRADPHAVASYLERLRADPAARPAGILWFRLPVSGDRRAWSARTLQTVIEHAPLVADFTETAAANANGSVDIWLSNRGTLDAVPPSYTVPPGCRWADALGPYQLGRSDAGLQLVPTPAAWLRAGERLRIGWARCNPHP